ncbi:HFX_2341 family transcriptional regulator domain-containing protein [Methanomethylophilus alvi]|uniref:HFX_2341 family transcriptional regulator domain-containing protein n=1 Tax=Methanomethylophilus alvi TaxID=1291540 RepID=UPI0037DBF0FD
MVYHVHLISVGKKAETAFNVINSEIRMDKIYLLNNDNEEYVAVENEIREVYSKFPLDGILTAKINPFDYDNVFKTVLDLFALESECHPEGVIFHINFTMGTRIAVAAMSSAAYSINADLYYIQEACYSPTGKDELILIPIENIEELSELKSRKHVLKTFMKFSDREPKTSSDLMGELKSAGSLSYHTTYLSKAGLIKRFGGVKNGSWVLTEKGEQVMKRL